MADQDLYKTLGVSREASADEIRKAYRKLARENHPDVKPDDQEAAERFAKIQEAYSVLGDPEKREQYDRYGAAFGGGAGGGRGYKWSTRGGPGGQPVDIDLNDIFGGAGGASIFEDLFAGGGFGGGGRTQGRRSTPPQRGQDLTIEAQVPFLVAAQGGKHELQLSRDGKPERLEIKVPAGVGDGSTIRLAGQGHPGAGGGSAGDLLVKLKVAPHPWFRREGNNLLVEIPVTPSEAALGAKVEVPTLSEGTVLMTVPEGTSSGTKLRLRGKGIADRKTGEPGDQFAVLKIVLPKVPDEETKELYRQLQERSDHSPRQGLW